MMRNSTSCLGPDPTSRPRPSFIPQMSLLSALVCVQHSRLKRFVLILNGRTDSGTWSQVFGRLSDRILTLDTVRKPNRKQRTAR